MKEKVSLLQQEVVQLETRKLCLSYGNLYPGGTLAGSVKEFTFFPNVDLETRVFDEANPNLPGLFLFRHYFESYSI